MFSFIVLISNDCSPTRAPHKRTEDGRMIQWFPVFVVWSFDQ